MEQEIDFQPQNDVLKFPLISTVHLNFHSLLFPNLASPESEVSIICHRLLDHFINVSEMLNTKKSIGKFAIPGWFLPFLCAKISMNWAF